MKSVRPDSGVTPSPFKPPTSADRLFYLLLTAASSLIVYKSFPKNLRGIATIFVGSFGLYHSFGCSCKCIQDTVSKFFGGSGGSGRGPFNSGWRCDYGNMRTVFWGEREGSYFSQSFNIFGNSTGRSSASSSTGAVDTTERQGKRRGGGGGGSSTSFGATTYTSSVPQVHNSGSSFPSTGVVDTGQRQGKRRGGGGGGSSTSYDTTTYDSSTPQVYDSSSNNPSTGAVDDSQRQEKRREGKRGNNW